MAHRRAGYQQIIGPNRLPGRFKLGSQFSGHLGIGFLKREHLKWASKEYFTPFGVLLLTGTLEHPVP
jgi:hypothetical protein